ncbi:MAG: J domain-containing protein [Spirobacillus cienkowskii]|uniref:J domain-containing protein n=1 Tax=Spirobacillus cienkowskii TaxID=495820 RepID=A0A369KUF8_9BACT|nr:MAG: J domain-containing protein [Spirobacillus cienkowskii]
MDESNMDIDFSDDDAYDVKRLEMEIKKQKKLEKQKRLENRKQIINDIQEILKQPKQQNACEEFEVCLLAANHFQRGTKSWALAFFNIQNAEPIDLSEVRKKYIKFAQSWHPDKMQVTSHDAMKYLNEAWQILKNNF